MHLGLTFSLKLSLYHLPGGYPKSKSIIESFYEWTQNEV